MQQKKIKTKAIKKFSTLQILKNLQLMYYSSLLEAEKAEKQEVQEKIKKDEGIYAF